MVGWSVSDLGGPSIIYWDHEMIKSIKELVKIRQSVFTLYSDTSTNRHIDGFLQDCSISSALAMEILQSCVKPWIWYQLMHLWSCLSTFLPKYFLQNIKNSLVAKRTIHGRTLGCPLDSGVAVGDWATLFQQHWSNDNVIKYCDWGIPHNWDMRFGRATNFGSFSRKLASKAGTN